MQPKRIPVIGPLITRHAEDAAFYWSQLDSSSRSFQWRIEDQLRSQNLLAAHLDGLAIAGKAGYDNCVAMFDRWKKGGNLFTCVYLASQLDLMDELDALVDQVQRQPDTLVRGLISALVSMPQEQARAQVSAWSSQSARPVEKVAALRAIALDGKTLRTAITCDLFSYFADSDPHVRAATCRAASTFEDQTASLTSLDQALLDENLQTRAEASIALLRTHLMEKAIPVLIACILQQSANIEKSSGWYRQQASRRLERWARNLAYALPIGAPELQVLLAAMPVRIALTMVLAHGDLAYLPFVVEKTRDPSVSRYAGWVWQTLTGTILTQMRWILKDDNSGVFAPPGPITQARLDADSGLPVPDHSAIASYMSTLPFAGLMGLRVLSGKQRNLANLSELFQEAPQCIRALAAEVLTHAEPGLTFNVWGLIQKRH